MDLIIRHEKDKKMFTMDIEGATAYISYLLKDGKMFLTYSEVPLPLRGKGYGKELVEKTFEQLTKEGYSAIAVCSYIKAVARGSEKWRTIIE